MFGLDHDVYLQDKKYISWWICALAMTDVWPRVQRAQNVNANCPKDRHIRIGEKKFFFIFNYSAAIFTGSG